MCAKQMLSKNNEIVSERRRYVRIAPPKPIKVRYRFIHGGNKPGVSPEDALSHSMSGGGLFLELPYIESGTIEELLKGEKKLSMEIELPNIAEPIKAVGRIVWLEGRKDGERYFYGAGVSFIRIDESDRDEIINYIIDLYLQENKANKNV